MSESNFDGWSKAIKGLEMSKREPMWDVAIKYLVDEGAMEPTIYDTLTQGQIQEIILEERYPENVMPDEPATISELFREFGRWLARIGEERRFYMVAFTTGNELWLAYLCVLRYGMGWRDVGNYKLMARPDADREGNREDMMVKVVYTLGYSRTTEKAFRERTWGIYKEIDAQLKLIDVRRLGSKSRNGKWCYQGRHVDGITPDYGMYITAMKCGWLDIESVPELGNDFGSTRESLDQYREWLFRQIQDPYSQEAEVIYKLVVDAKRTTLMKTMQEYVLVLLCAEMSHKACHRVHVADALVNVLGDGWTVKHL